MKLKLSLVQMSALMAKPEENFKHAVTLMNKAMEEKPDVLVLPETLNTGFFPRENLESFADPNGETAKEIFSKFSKEHSVNIVAGSVTTKKNGKIFNTSYTFDRQGNCISEYDKIHGFTPMSEHHFYQGGNHIVDFELDGVKCSTIICYDMRFCELVRAIALQGTELLFIVAHWPLIRKKHWLTLTTARAIENQMFVCAVNASSTDGDTKYGGNSILLDPWGEEICHLGEDESIGYGDVDLDIIKDIRASINVFRDRKPELYKTFSK